MTNIPKFIASMLVGSVCAVLSAHAASTTDQTLPVRKPAPAPAAMQAPEPDSKYLSVLERFRSYTGARSPAALCELFVAPVNSRVRQQPEVVLSSGAVPVSISIVLNSSAGFAPNFAFNGARLISYLQTKPNEWLIEALPDTGVMKAEMIVLMDSVTMNVPLNVAPPLPAETDLSEKGFISFLGGKTSSPQPLQDLNGDGRYDYQDDYIFTANYLARKNSPAAGHEVEVPAAVGAPSIVQGSSPQGSAARSEPEPPSASPGTTPAAGPVSREQYNSMTYEQKKRLRNERARQGMQPITTPGQ